MATAVGWAPIIKSEKTDRGTLIITGKAADSAIDRDYQIADESWLDKAMGQWYGEPDGGNIREQHDGKRAVGTAIEYQKGTDGGHYITAEIVDPVTVSKIENRVLKGFSWSARNARVTVDKAAKGGRIVDGQIYEVSVVDRPANPACRFTIAKADDGGDLELVEEPELVEKVDEPRFSPSDLKKVLDSLNTHADPLAMYGDDLHKFVSADKRREYADKGIAMPNGDFPIPDEGHLRSAVGHLENYEGDKTAAKKHIIKRARALGLTKLLPDEWGVSKAWDALDTLEKTIGDLDGLDLSKVDAVAAAHENLDIADGKAAIAAIARLIISEATELAEGHLCEIDDIQMLTNAACALQCFIESEAHEVSSHMPPTTAGAVVAAEPVIEAAKTDNPTDDPATVAKTDGGTGTPEPGAVLTEDTLSGILDTAIAKAVQPYKDELDVVKAELAEVKATPMPGGPARVRTQAATAVAEKADALRSSIDQLRAEVAGTNDKFLREGYQKRLDAARGELSKLDG